MAGVAHAATLGQADFLNDIMAPLLGDDARDIPNNRFGVQVPFNQWTNGTAPYRGDPELPTGDTGRSPDLHLAFNPDGAGTQTDDMEGAGGAIDHVGVEHAALGLQDKIIFDAEQWFEAIHILPKALIAFGNIITLVEDEYEIYSAFRNDPATENAITNNALPGINLPDNVPPVIFPRQTSLLDSSTTGQTTGALGTLVTTKIEALANGLPNFDTDIIFEFTPPANDVLLLVSGSRIVLIPFEYEVDAKETLAFLTNIIPAIDGNEQRIALRKNPRQSFQVEFDLSDDDRQALQALLFDWQANLFGFPLWHERLKLTAATIVGATQYPVSGADDVDFRIGGLAAVITDRNVFDVIEVAAVSDVLITATSPSLNPYPIGTAIMPVRICIVPNLVNTLRHLNNQENFKLTFQVTDNDTGAPTGDVTPGFWSTFNSRVLFDDCLVIDGASMGTRLTRRLYRTDNKTGLVEQSAIWDRNKRESQKGFLARSRAEILALRKLFIGLQGRQKAFYIPTFIEELTVNADLQLGLATMDIVHIGYVRFVQDRLPFSLFRITFSDGTDLIRTVLSSLIVDATTERLTVDSTWPATRTVAEIERIEWFELARFDSDQMVLTYPRIGLATTQLPVKRVFDDNV